MMRPFDGLESGQENSAFITLQLRKHTRDRSEQSLLLD